MLKFGFYRTMHPEHNPVTSWQIGRIDVADAYMLMGISIPGMTDCSMKKYLLYYQKYVCYFTLARKVLEHSCSGVLDISWLANFDQSRKFCKWNEFYLIWSLYSFVHMISICTYINFHESRWNAFAIYIQCNFFCQITEIEYVFRVTTIYCRLWDECKICLWW